jgi:Fe-S oxidoreductase
MVTREEEHSTRGRAHMLFELLQGEVLRDGWKDEHVKKSLDLCLSCKACKSECPANVDVATYKAEFLSHYYEGTRRPVQAHLFGKIDRWARLASAAPRLANFLGGAPGFRHLLGSIFGLAPQRELPQLARLDFRRWAERHNPTLFQNKPNAEKRQVVLWIDTFNNYFHPETSRAAVNVLERAGFAVKCPQHVLCCGRPLYDFGMLTEAKRYLAQIMDALGADLDAGLPIVVLEPSCASVFRDELRNLFPRDARAKRLQQQTFLLSEFLEKHAPDYVPAKLAGKILVHGHCHHKALMKMRDEESLLRRTGASVESPDAGCCGMAGPFGFEREKFAIAQAIGERVLLPAVRNAQPDTLIVADGFSCREQIRQSTGRTAIHLAEVLQATSATTKTKEPWA